MAFMPCFEDLCYFKLLHEKNIYNIHMRNSDAGQDDRAALKESLEAYPCIYIIKKLDKGSLGNIERIQIQYLFLHLSPTIMLHDVPMLGCLMQWGDDHGTLGSMSVNGQQC
ncbi:hypothetical protein ACJX0J_011766 [Zea mays]